MTPWPTRAMPFSRQARASAKSPIGRPERDHAFRPILVPPSFRNGPRINPPRPDWRRSRSPYTFVSDRLTPSPTRSPGPWCHHLAPSVRCLSPDLCTPREQAKGRSIGPCRNLGSQLTCLERPGGNGTGEHPFQEGTVRGSRSLPGRASRPGSVREIEHRLSHGRKLDSRTPLQNGDGPGSRSLPGRAL